MCERERENIMLVGLLKYVTESQQIESVSDLFELFFSIYIKL